ncbi:MAG: hypothetical protein ACJ75H_23425 [Thermoanaerobaculia bacterium]
MSAKKVHVELLSGRVVRDPDGVKVGRINSFIAEPEGDDLVLREYHLGPAALLIRFGISVRSLFGWPGHREPLRVAWDQMDLRDPDHPRLLVPADEVRSGSAPPRPPSAPRRKPSAE